MPKSDFSTVNLNPKVNVLVQILLLNIKCKCLMLM